MIWRVLFFAFWSFAALLGLGSIFLGALWFGWRTLWEVFKLMNPKLIAWAKRVGYLSLIVVAQQILTNIPALVAILPAPIQAHFGPLILLMGAAVLHELPSPGGSNGTA